MCAVVQSPHCLQKYQHKLVLITQQLWTAYHDKQSPQEGAWVPCNTVEANSVKDGIIKQNKTKQNPWLENLSTETQFFHEKGYYAFIETTLDRLDDGT